MPVDPEQLRKTCVYESRAPLDTISADIEQIKDLAAQWHKTRRTLLLSGIGAIVAGFVCFFVFPPAGVVLVALGIGLFFFMKRYPKGVANSLFRCGPTKTIASLLARDTDPKAASTLRLTFNPAQEMLSETVLPNRRNGKQKTYKESWFSVETDLLDGTSFTETVDDIVRKRSFTNPRGKSKTKTRTRQIVSMRFAYRPEVYGDLRPLATMMQKEIKLPPSAAVRGLEVTERAVKVKALVTQAGDLANTSTMLALGVYRILNLSRRLHAQTTKRFGKGGSQ